MTREPIYESVPVFDASASQEIAPQLKRIADTLDDYMEMSLVSIELTRTMQAADPEVAHVVQPLIDAFTRIRQRREAR